MSEEHQETTPETPVEALPPPGEPDAPSPGAATGDVGSRDSKRLSNRNCTRRNGTSSKFRAAARIRSAGALERRIKLENLEPFVGRIVVPVEKVTEVRDGKRRIKKVKKFPGYLFCEVEFNEHVLYLFRETSGVGDFVGGTGAGPNRLPQPMSEREVQRMLADQEELAPGETPGKKAGEESEVKGRIKLDYDVGDTVKVREGMFANMEGPVKLIADRDSQTPKVKVELTIWGRPVEVDLDYWQVDRV